MGYTQLAILVGKTLICPFDLWVPYFQTNPLCGWVFQVPCSMQFQGVIGCSWQKVPMIFQQSALRCHILRNPRRRLGHVTYLPDHQRQRVLDGIYDSWIQPGSWIPGGLLNGRGTQGDTSLACPP